MYKKNKRNIVCFVNYISYNNYNYPKQISIFPLEIVFVKTPSYIPSHNFYIIIIIQLGKIISFGLIYCRIFSPIILHCT